MKYKSLCGAAAALALVAGTQSAAQNNDAPIDVTAAPPATAETVGPAQLRDFNLQGTVTRPAERPAASANQPVTTASAPPRSGEAVPSAAASGPAPARPDQVASNGASSPAIERAPGNLDVAPPPSVSAPVTPSLPLEVTTDPAPQPGFDGMSSSTGDSLAPTDISAAWPWLAALLALAAGGAFMAWSRRGRRNRYGDPGRMAFAGLAPDVVPDAKPYPPARPRPDAAPQGGGPVTAPAPKSTPLPKPVDDGLIVSKRLKPELSFQFVPDRVVVTGLDAMLQFDIVITNSGSAPARDVLVEARMFTAHPAQDRDIASFFQNPIGTGDRIPAIVPLGKLSLKSAVQLPIDQLHSFEVDGRKLFVPLIGFNILFRSSGGDGQASASFLVGRGSEQDEKLAPFRLDLGPRVFRGLTARAHSMGLQPA